MSSSYIMQECSGLYSKTCILQGFIMSYTCFKPPTETGWTEVQIKYKKKL